MVDQLPGAWQSLLQLHCAIEVQVFGAEKADVHEFNDRWMFGFAWAVPCRDGDQLETPQHFC